MKKIFSFLLIAFLLSLSLSYGAENDKLHVTYIANEGFLIECGGKKILIDALFDDKTIDFCDVPSMETLNKILAAQSPFDDVDLLLVTHQHRDHFNKNLVITYLKNNKHCDIIGPHQVVDQLRGSNEFEEVEEQVISIMPTYARSEDISINGIKLVVLRFQHVSYFVTDEQTGEKVDRHKNIQNLGFVINLGNYKILHTGDSFLQNIEEYKSYRLDKEQIDIAFLALFFDPLKIEAVNNYIKPQNIIVMHLPKDKKIVFELRDMHQSSLAPITIFTKELEQKEFNK